MFFDGDDLLTDRHPRQVWLGRRVHARGLRTYLIFVAGQDMLIPQEQANAFVLSDRLSEDRVAESTEIVSDFLSRRYLTRVDGLGSRPAGCLLECSLGYHWL